MHKSRATKRTQYKEAGHQPSMRNRRANHSQRVTPSLATAAVPSRSVAPPTGPPPLPDRNPEFLGSCGELSSSCFEPLTSDLPLFWCGCHAVFFCLRKTKKESAMLGGVPFILKQIYMGSYVLLVPEVRDPRLWKVSS